MDERERRTGGGEVWRFLAIAAALLAVVLVVGRQVIPALVLLSIAAVLFVIGRRTPPPEPVGPVLTGVLGPPARPAETDEPRALDEPGVDDVIPHLPHLPSGTRRGPWAPPARRVRVRSHRRHASAMGRARRRAPGVRATLVSDTVSPNHPYAVAVFVDDEHVGDLAGDDVLDYGPTVARLATGGTDVEVEAILTPSAMDLVLPDPAGLAPANPIPEGVVLPHGAHLRVQPLVDEAERAAAAAALSRHLVGEEAWLAVVVRIVRPGRRRDPVNSIEVDLDGVLIGRLTGPEAEDLVPLLTYVGDRHVTAVAAGWWHGPADRGRLTLSCIRASDADDSWLRSLSR